MYAIAELNQLLTIQSYLSLHTDTLVKGVKRVLNVSVSAAEPQERVPPAIAPSTVTPMMVLPAPKQRSRKLIPRKPPSHKYAAREVKRKDDIIDHFFFNAEKARNNRFKGMQQDRKTSRQRKQMEKRLEFDQEHNQQRPPIATNDTADSRELNGESNTSGRGKSERKADEVFIEGLGRELKDEMDRAVNGLGDLLN